MSDDPRLNEFLAALRAEVNDAAIEEVQGTDDVASVLFREQAFSQVMVEFLEDHGQLADTELCFVEKYFGRAIGKYNGWHVDVDNGVATVITTIYRGLDGLRSITATELTQVIRRAVRAFEAALDGSHRDMEPATCAYDSMEAFHSTSGEIDRLRVVVLGDGFAADPGPFESETSDFEVTVDIWDVRRCFRLASSGLPYEPIAIDVRKRLGRPLECIGVPRSGDRDFDVYMTVLPGDLLHELYHEYGPRILELNVRSFLQARGKVNRGIRDTLKDEPARFVAYNNGISATAEHVEIVSTDRGPAIAGIRGLQIVNGGQTVASIHRAKERERHDLTDVFVQAKLTCVGPEMIDELVPRISRYANTQNAVREADFSANHPFHVRLQQLSETVWAPGEQTKWFYERARGQYEVAMQRDGTTPARRRRFKQTHPKTQSFDKVELAKYANSWARIPHIVSRGGQKNFAAFMDRLVRQKPADWEPDEAYFRDTIANAIIFKEAERVARQHAFPGYRANAITYTVALLSYRTAGRIDLGDVWNHQAASEPMRDAIYSWMPLIYDELIESSEGRNVTEWCKKEECWRHIQTIDVTVSSDLQAELSEGQPLPTVGAAGRRSDQALSAEDRENIARVMQVPAQTWVNVVGWGATTGELQKWQCGIATTLASYAAAGWSQVPSAKQAKHGATIMRLAEENGGLPLEDE